MVQVRSVDQNETLETIRQILDEDGCIVIKNILSPNQLQSIRNEMEEQFSKIDNCSGDFYGYVTKRFSGLFSKAPFSRQMAIHPVIIAVMDEFLLRGCEQYQMNLTQAIRIGPGEPQQILHRDDAMFPFEHPQFEAMINCMWAIDDFTCENGATNLVPGSHKWDRLRQPEPHEVAQGAMPAGSVLIYLGSLIHCGGANKTEKPRTGLVLSYCTGWLRQAENFYLAVSQAEASGFPEKLQRLIGYFVHKPNLGCVEGQDPIMLLKGETFNGKPFTEFLPDEVKPLLKEHRETQIKAA